MGETFPGTTRIGQNPKADIQKLDSQLKPILSMERDHMKGVRLTTVIINYFIYFLI